MRALATTDEQVAFWHSHAKQGIMLCFVVPLVIVLDVLLAPDARHPVALYAIAAFMALVGVLVPLVPMEKVVRHARGRLFFDAWDGTGIALTCITMLLDEGIDSPYVAFLYILLAHAAMAFPPVGTMVAGGGAVIGYDVVGALSGAGALDLVTGSVLLAAMTGTCAVASWNRVRSDARASVLTEQLAELAERDGLTDLLNHRAFHQRLSEESARATQERELSVVLIDVDEFKTVNDTFGHSAGDAVLRLVAGVLAEHCGRGGHAGRVGGDEFALLLPATPHAQALVLATRACRAVREAGEPYGTSVSAGVASTVEPDAVALLAEADAAVYHAKRTGRDRVVSAPSHPPQDRRRSPGSPVTGPLAAVADLAG